MLEANETLPGIHLERVIFKKHLKNFTDELRSAKYDKYMSSFFPEVELDKSLAPKIKNILLAFSAGMQFGFDKTQGKKAMPLLAIGDHEYKDKPLMKPAYYHRRKVILLPRSFVLEWAKGEDNEMVNSERDGKQVGTIPKLAMIGRTGAEEVSHAIWRQQGKPIGMEFDDEYAQPEGYSDTPIEKEGRRIAKLFLNEVCDITNYDNE